jgi:hypothetical protein
MCQCHFWYFLLPVQRSLRTSDYFLVSPRVGGVPGLEVLVQGKQSTVVLDYLTTKGIPKKWIEVTDLVGGKK